jgi:hypothetical protein
MDIVKGNNTNGKYTKVHINEVKSHPLLLRYNILYNII